MKKTTIEMVECKQPGGIEVEVSLPARLVHVAMAAQQSALVDASKKRSIQQFPMLFVEVEPDAPKVMRRYLVVPQGAILQANEPGRAMEYRATCQSPFNGALFHAYEFVDLGCREAHPSIPPGERCVECGFCPESGTSAVVE